MDTTFLTKSEKIVLSYLQSNREECTSNTDLDVALSETALQKYELDGVLSSLYKRGLIEENYGAYSGLNVLTVQLTYEGLNYSEFKSLFTKELRYKSIYIPIIVSVASSSLLVPLLRLLLQKILHIIS